MFPRTTISVRPIAGKKSQKLIFANLRLTTDSSLTNSGYGFPVL
jgi:hypothetical protein